MPLYFAYGSNMDDWQMRERCPSATFVCVARLDDFKLCFPRFSKRRHGGVSSVEKSEGNIVWGVVFSIPETEIPLLDKSEGYDPGREASKNAYNRTEMHVTDCQRDRLTCYIYIANVDKPSKPSRECYLNYIIRGAEQHKQDGMPDEYIQMLRGIDADD